MPVEQMTPRPSHAATPEPALRLVGGTATEPGGSPVAGSTNEPLRVLQVRPWDDPRWRRAGHDARSAYAERFWVGALGPSAMWLLRLLAREFDELAPNEDLQLDLSAAAKRLGLQYRGGRHSSLMRTIDRCIMFDLAHFENDALLVVRRLLPPVPRTLQARMPAELQEEVGRWSRIDGPADFSVGETRLLATCMLTLGHGLHEAAERLVTLGLTPRDANEATAWAWAERSMRQRKRRRA